MTTKPRKYKKRFVDEMFERVIAVISKSPSNRQNTEIDILLPWLRKKSDLLRGLEKDILVDLIRNCEYEKAQVDDVIIRQGDKGDSFYIMLTGKTSIYIDTTKSDDDPPKLDSGEDTNKTILDELEEEKKQQKKKNKLPLDRSEFGKFIINFDAGKSFGEIALMADDSVRNASIIADEETDLLVIHRDLFNRSLKAKQEQEYQERKDFIDDSPLFRKWNPKFKRLLEMSLRKEVLPYEGVLVKQGQPVIGLHFIIKGQAKIVIEPTAHAQQYPRLYDYKSARSSKPSTEADGTPDEKLKDSTLREHIRVRRKEGYAAAERRLAQKSIHLCFVDESEVIGATELVMNFDTYMQTIICNSNTEVFILDNKNVDRLIHKKNTQTIDKLRARIETKLRVRRASKLGSQVSLFGHILNHIDDTKPKKTSRFYKVRNTAGEDREQMMSQLVDLFLADRAQLLEPTVPGAVFYMAKAFERHQVNANQTQARSIRQNVEPEVRLQRARRFSRRKRPRSRRELERLAVIPNNHLAADEIVDNGNGWVRYLNQAGLNVNQGNQIRPHTTGRKVAYATPRPYADQNGESIFKLTEIIQAEVTDAKNLVDMEDINEESIQEVVSNMGEQQLMRNANRTKLICSMVEKQNTQQVPPSIHKLLRPHSAPVRPQAYVFSDDEEEDGNAEEFDDETSESSLQQLEKKIQLFHDKFDVKKSGKVTELKRFVIETPDDIPIPGGTVYIKHRTCKFPAGAASSPSHHQHIRRFMIPRNAHSAAQHVGASSGGTSQATRPRTGLPNGKSQSLVKRRSSRDSSF